MPPFFGMCLACWFARKSSTLHMIVACPDLPFVDSADALGQGFEWSAAAKDALRSGSKSPEDEFVIIRVDHHD